MAKRRRAKKHIKEDQLVTWTVELSRWAQEHFVPIVVGVGAFVVVIGAVIFTANSRQDAGKQAERQLSSAMSLLDRGDLKAAQTTLAQLANRVGGRYGTIATYFQAEANYRQANYSDAIKGYNAYLKESSKFPMFRSAALFARALCYEGAQDYAKAASAMADLVGELDPADPRYADAAYRAGEFFAKTGDTASAEKYYRLAAGTTSGQLAERARVAADLIKR